MMIIPIYSVLFRAVTIDPWRTVGSLPPLLLSLGANFVKAVPATLPSRAGRSPPRGKLFALKSFEYLLEPREFVHQLAPTQNRGGVVYSRTPVAGADQVLDRVGRHAHRVSLSINRLLDNKNWHVKFSGRDHRDGNQPKTTILSPASSYVSSFWALSWKCFNLSVITAS